jgi:dephospho-CoA kinase
LQRVLKVGLTGGIASGKSTVAEMFAGYGIPVIDTDLIARELVLPGMPALNAIRQRFGDRILSPDGTLDRGALRKIVFESDDSRKALEAILHPRIRRETVDRSHAAKGPYQIIVVPLLVESTLKSMMDRIVVIDCDAETQLRRLLSRDAESQEQAMRMIASQASRSERLAIASDVILNNGDLDETRRQVDSLHREFIGIASAESAET